VTRRLTLPAAALHALRAAVLATPDGELRLRDAGFAAGGALFESFDESTRERAGVDAGALPLGDFLQALSASFAEQGWGALHVTADDAADTITLAGDDWAEAAAERDGAAAYPTCHFSTGMFAGFLARVAGRPLAVLEVRCRAAGAPRCEFIAGSPEVMDRLWEALMRGEAAAP
jgi:hypothetical protein